MKNKTIVDLSSLKEMLPKKASSFTVGIVYLWLETPDGVSMKIGIEGDEVELVEVHNIQDIIVIPDGITIIGSNCFTHISKLKHVEFPKTLKRIRYAAFQSCRNLGGVSLPEGLKYIESYAFDGCESITKVRIPDSVTIIGPRSFGGCTALKEAYVSEEKGINLNFVFEDCNILQHILSSSSGKPFCERK